MSTAPKARSRSRDVATRMKRRGFRRERRRICRLRRLLLSIYGKCRKKERYYIIFPPILSATVGVILFLSHHSHVHESRFMHSWIPHSLTLALVCRVTTTLTDKHRTHTVTQTQTKKHSYLTHHCCLSQHVQGGFTCRQALRGPEVALRTLQAHKRVIQ